MRSEPHDDVIRIRIDTSRAVEAFLRLLAEQAQDGETRAPANPAATAIWRELAPFRLVEYAYVDDGVGLIDGACLGFPDGSIYAVDDEIPERAVTALVAGNEHRAVPLDPVYVYVLLRRPAGLAAIERFLTRLSGHVGAALVGVLPCLDGGLCARVFDSEASEGVARETARHLSHDRLAAGLAARSCRDDGRAYATIGYAFSSEILEFANSAARDAFLDWTRVMTDWIFTQDADPLVLGLAEAYQPARPAPVPDSGQRLVRLDPPSVPLVEPLSAASFQGYWQMVCRAIESARAEPG